MSITEEPVHCRIWVSAPDATAVGELTPAECARWERFRQQDDRDRFATGRALVRHALRVVTGDPAAVVVRICEDCGGTDHGPMTAAGEHGDTVGVSLSHSGDRVVVAVARGATRVGVDVERVRPRVAGVARMLCTEREAAADLASGDPSLALTTRWVRKEAILKAAHTGLRVPLRDLEVTRHDEPAAVRRWHHRTRPPEATDGVVCHDLGTSVLGQGYVGCLAVLTAGPVRWELGA
jgi:4'-phosphopantetheinyl transferase